jgi:hypothetical protein
MNHSIPKKKKKIILYIALMAIGYYVFVYSSVSNDLSKEDSTYIEYYLKNIVIPSPSSSYKEQLSFIHQVQNSVLAHSPNSQGIPLGTTREPKDLYLRKSGLCFDRSRVIEKILRYAGFQTRHVSLYSKQKTNSAIKSLFTPGVSSHAVTEVLTRKGWLLVDSNSPWLALDTKDQPYSLKKMQNHIEHNSSIQWKAPPPTPLYTHPFVYVIGLYSRHGMFYPPYNYIPDINYLEFFQNIEQF